MKKGQPLTKTAMDGPSGGSKRRPSLLSAGLFLTGWGGALFVGVAFLEKMRLFYSGSDVSPGIYGLLFGVMTAAGLAVGLAAAIIALPVMALSSRRHAIQALAGSLLVGVAVQLFVTFHPEFIWGEGAAMIGAHWIARGAGGLVAAVAVSALTLRAKRTFPVLVLAASALLSGVASGGLVDGSGMLNVISMPLILLVSTALLYELAGKRLPFIAALVPAALMPAALVLLSAISGTPAAKPVDHGRPRDEAKVAMLAGKPNVVIIVLDTLRGDHVSALGYDRPTTPRIDEFLKGATLYRKAKSVSSWTLAAHGSLFTGLWPRSHGAHFAEESLSPDAKIDERAVAYPLSANTKTLAEILSGLGYATAGIASNYAWLTDDFSLNRGFDYYTALPRYRQEMLGRHEKLPVSSLLDLIVRLSDRWRDGNYNERKPYYRAPEISAGALKWLSRHSGDPFFLFVNYWDPHSPYNPPAPYDTMFPGKISPRGRKVDWLKDTDALMRGLEDIDPAYAAELISQYDGEIAYMDEWVGRFLDGMKKENVYEESLVVVVSDHGEGFGNHRYMEHGASLYEDETAILLAVKFPGQTEPRVVDSNVQILDVFATVLSELHIPLPEGTSGEHLDSVTHPIVAELYPPQGRVEHYGERFARRLVALYDGDMKAIVSTKGDRELYDLAADAREAVNLSDDARLPAMLEKIERWQEDTPPAPPSAAGVLDEEAIERLKVLGYL